MDRTSSKVKRLINSAIKYLSSYFQIEKVILFGSQANGKARRYSDIDIAVVSPDFVNINFDDLLGVFSKVSLEVSSDIEIHPFTPKDISEARPTNFIGHILETGKIVYTNLHQNR